MQLWIFYQSCDFYESFLQFNGKIQRKQSVQKAEQLMVAKYFSLIKGILGVLWTIIIGYMRLIHVATVILYQRSEFCDEF